MATPSQENRELVQEFIREANAKNYDRVAELFTDDYIRHDPNTPTDEQGLQPFVEALKQLHEAFPDSEVHVGEIIAEDDLVAFEGTMTGTHEGEFRGVEPTHTEFEIPGNAMHRVRNGQISETWATWDFLGVFQQLGVVEPPPEPMATTETGLRERLDEVGSILASGDAERIRALYTQESRLLPPGRDFVTGRDAAAEFWQGVGDVGVETIDIDSVEVETHESTARRVGRATLADADGATIDQVKFIEIWNREDGEWRIHRDIWNSSISEER